MFPYEDPTRAAPPRGAEWEEAPTVVYLGEVPRLAPAPGVASPARTRLRDRIVQRVLALRSGTSGSSPQTARRPLYARVPLPLVLSTAILVAAASGLATFLVVIATHVVPPNVTMPTSKIWPGRAAAQAAPVAIRLDPIHVRSRMGEIAEYAPAH